MEVPALYTGQGQAMSGGGFLRRGAVGADTHPRVVRGQREGEQRTDTVPRRLGDRLGDERRRVFHPDVGTRRQARLPQRLHDAGGLAPCNLKQRRPAADALVAGP